MSRGGESSASGERAASTTDVEAAGARRFRPRALPTLAAIAAIVVCVAAGTWQRERLLAKETLRAQFDAASRAEPAPLPGPAADADWAALRFLPVVATGEFVASGQILVDNKVHAGRAGYDVVTPLALADGRAVLVDRGWTPQGASRSQLPDVPPPTGVVQVRGRLALPAGYVELQRTTPVGALWQNLDPARYSSATGLRVLPVVIEAAAASDPDDGLIREWPLPDFGAERHRIYMVQWYAFAALAAGIWLWFSRRERRPDRDD
ncbi:MAG TPA: SURF1 family protein [Casimicrobiaceae bacterium]|nr:SURF1 family protein [Casimicrobiaceae bacterium]